MNDLHDTPDAPLDEAILDRLRRLAKDVARPGEDVLGELRSLFEADARVRAAGFAAACARGDLAEAQALAHALKGAAANVGAVSVRAVCARCEAAARDGDHRALVGAPAELSREVERAVAALAAALAAP